MDAGGRSQAFKSCCILLCLLFFSQANAQRLPEWELGVAAGYVKIPYYRGAATARNILLPLPLAIYRSKKSNAKRRLFGSKRISLELSLAANLPVPEGRQVAAREGMPGLDASLEFGSSLNLLIWKRRRHLVAAALPLRAVSSVSFFEIGYQGWRLSPFVSYSYNRKSKNGWKLSVSAGPSYAARAYHAYYYSVDRIYATQTREFFQAKQGYSGSRLSVYAQKSVKRLWLSVFARYDMLSGAVFEESPLVERKNTLFAGFVVGWVFKKSPNSIYVTD